MLVDVLQAVSMFADHPQHGLAIHRIASKRSRHFGDFGTRQVRLAGHQGCHRRRIGAPSVGIVRQTACHKQRSEVCVAQPQRAKRLTIPCNRWRRVAGVVHENFLRRDQNVHDLPVRLSVKLPIRLEALQQVDLRKIAGRVIEEDELTAGIRSIDPTTIRAGVPVVNSRIELHPRITADVRRLSDHVQQVAGVITLTHSPRGEVARLPDTIVEHRVHESV